MPQKESRQHKQINNRPVKSPSPDNLSKNRNVHTIIELRQTQFNMNTSPSVSPSKFPTIPYDLILKNKRKSEEENRNPTLISPGLSKGGNQYTTPTAKPKSQKKHSSKIPEVSNFQVSMNEDLNDHQFSQILYEVSEIFSIISDSKIGGLTTIARSSSKEDLTDYLQKLEMIKSRVLEWVSNSRLPEQKGKTFKYSANSPQLKNKNDSIWYSPIGKQLNDQESQFSLLQTNEIQNQNHFLRRQIAMLKLELQYAIEAKNMEGTVHGRSEQYQPKTILNKQKESDQNSEEKENKLLKQKVNYLQKELEDKIDRLLEMERNKNEQIRDLQHKLESAEMARDDQMQTSDKIIQHLQTKINSIDSYPHKDQPEQTIHIFASEKKPVRKTSETLTFLKPERKNTETAANRSSMKKGLPWDKEQIVSIYDKERHPDEDQYSEAERVDIQNLFATKRELETQIERMKEIYEQRSQLNENRHQSHLLKLQSELRAIKEYIEQFDIQNHEDGIDKSILMAFEFEKSEYEKQINLMKKQVQYERKQNQQLRNLIYKIHNEQHSNVCPTQSKRRGAQKLRKSYAKSEKIKNDTLNTYNSFEEDAEQEYK